MADEKLTQQTEIYEPDLDGLFYEVDDPAGTPGSRKIKTRNALNRFVPHYLITPTVSSDDLVLTVTHADGTTPSSSRPLWFKIGNTWRKCTAALTVTKADGTSWAALGGTSLGALPHDLFVYVVWNTNLTPDAVDVFWARKPYGSLYSYFSGTTTNEDYAAINSTAPAATDECEVIGRFQATLSLTGTGHVWTVPTYTNDNLINRPIYKGRILSYTPSPSNITVGDGTLECYYQVKDSDEIWVYVDFILGSTSAVSGVPVFPLPFTKKSVLDSSPLIISRFFDANVGAPAWAGLALINDGAGLTMIAQDASGTYLRQVSISSTVPFTWAVSDRLTAAGSYPVGGA